LVHPKRGGGGNIVKIIPGKKEHQDVKRGASNYKICKRSVYNDSKAKTTIFMGIRFKKH